MTKMNTTTKTTLPKAPRDPEKARKSFLAKLIERVTRAIKAVNEVETRTAEMHAAPPAAHREGVDSARGSSVDAKASLHELLEELTSLQDAGYAHTGGKRTLAPGAQVWLRKGIWERKYAGLYSPAELDGLQIVTVSGKSARAKSESGVQIAEPVNAFTTTPTSYEAVEA